MNNVNKSRKIKVAIVGIGNCCSSLIQGIHYYGKVKDDERLVNGLMHNTICGYAISDIEIVAAFDVDKRKVGKDVSLAIFEKPNCTKIFCPDIPLSGTIVKMGPVLDGVSPHMLYFDEDQTFVVASEDPINVSEELRKSGAEILICYLPVGSQKAVEYYADAAIKAGCGFINCMPIFIVSDSEWEGKFREAGLPCIGDDVKSQVGATIVNRVLVDLFVTRGIQVTESDQPNWGGNTDFLNMLLKLRNITKLISKRESIESLLPEKLPEEKLYAGPAGYIPSLYDSKIADITVKGNQFGDIPMEVKAHLSVEDSPNSAGCIIDAIRIMKLALNRGIGGAIIPASAYFMKHPPQQMKDNEARIALEKFISDGSRNALVCLSRIKDVAESGEDYSEVWTDIAEGVRRQADNKGISLDIFAPDDCYGSGLKTVNLVRQAIRKLKSYGPGYEKNLLIPFSVTDRELKNEMIVALQDAPEINIYAVNVPPDEEFITSLPNIKGYIGMDEFSLGKNLLREMTSRVDVSRVVVLRHEDNQYAHELRISGILLAAQENNVEVVVLNHLDRKAITEAIIPGKTGIITLGNRGTEKVFDLDTTESVVPVVTVDFNRKVERFSIESNKKILVSFVQKGLYGSFSYGDQIINPAKLTS